jgi:hypothetical protein
LAALALPVGLLPARLLPTPLFLVRLWPARLFLATLPQLGPFLVLPLQAEL